MKTARLLLTVAIICIYNVVAIAHDIQQLGVSGLRFSIDDKKSATLLFDLQPSAFSISKESEVIIQPVIAAENSGETFSFPEIIIAGRNRYLRYDRRQRVIPEQTALYSVKDDKQVSFVSSVDFEDWMKDSRLTFNVSVKGCCGKPQQELSIPVAEIGFSKAIFSAPEFKIDTNLKREPKIRELQGSAFIDFKVNRIDIDPRYRRNVNELSKILSTINVVKENPDATITDIYIKGFASPEGSYANNIRLAKGRTLALKDYVKSEYAFSDDIFHTSFEPEDWAGLRDSVAASSMRNKDEMLKLIDSSKEPDAKDAELKLRFPEEYRSLLTGVYPALRHSDYLVKYRIKEYEGSDEIRKALDNYPENLNSEELLRLIATYTPGSRIYDETVDKGISLFPENGRLNYLKGVALAEKGDYDAAIPYLSKSSKSGIPEASVALESIMKVTATTDPVKYILDNNNYNLVK